MNSRIPRARFRSALPLLCLLAIPGLSHVASADTVLTAPAAAAGTVAVVPAGPTRGMTPVIVAAAIDTTGNADNAKRALRSANEALVATPGYSPAASKAYDALAGAKMKDADWAWPFTATDYQKIGKVSKAACALTISVTPGTDGSFSAVAEMYNTKNGGLTGYGKATSSSDATADTAIESAVWKAVIALGETAKVPGIILSKPAPNMARISTGFLTGIRGGARVEYLGDNGEPVAFGTIVDIAAGEALATVAPETAFPDLYANGKVRVIDNPSEKRALLTAGQIQEKDYKSFEKSFTLSAGIATAVYFLAYK